MRRCPGGTVPTKSDAPSMPQALRRACASGMRRAYAEQNRTEQNTNEESFLTYVEILTFVNAGEKR